MSQIKISKENKTFLNEFKSLVERLESKSDIEKKTDIKFTELLRIAEFLTEVKPQSHSQIYKDELINYLTLLESFYSNTNTSKSDYLRLKGQKLNPVIQFMRKYGFRTRFNLIQLNLIFGIILDFVFYLLIYPDNFYFLPVFTVILFINGVIKLKKVKSNNKLLKI
tara:strand:+ start:56 stop:553 length:498 start_codon:yes stop_codon:yes gene_type:complete